MNNQTKPSTTTASLSSHVTLTIRNSLSYWKIMFFLSFTSYMIVAPIADAFITIPSNVMISSTSFPSKSTSTKLNYQFNNDNVVVRTTSTSSNKSTTTRNTSQSKNLQNHGNNCDIFPSNIHEFASFIYESTQPSPSQSPSSVIYHATATAVTSASTEPQHPQPLQEYQKILQTHEQALLHKGPLNPQTIQLLKKIIASINKHRLQTKFNDNNNHYLYHTQKQSSTSYNNNNNNTIQQRHQTYIGLKNTLESILSRKKAMSHTSKSLHELYIHDLPIFQTLALLYVELNMMTEAIELYEQVIYEIQKVSIGEDHESCIQTLCDIGNLYSGSTGSSSSNYESARRYYLKAYSLCKKHLGMVHEVTISVLQSLSNLYLSNRDIKDNNENMAYLISNKCLNTIITSGNMNLITPQTAFMTLHNLALYHQLSENNNNDEKEQSMQQQLGQQSSSYLSSLSKPSSTPRTIKNINDNQSLKLYQKCLQQQIQHLGPNHYDTLVTMHNLSTLYYNLEQYKLGINTCQQCFLSRRQLLGMDDYDTLLSLSNLGMLYEANGELDKAKVIYGICWEVQCRVLGKDHVDTLLTKDGLDRLNHVVIKVDNDNATRVIGHDVKANVPETVVVNPKQRTTGSQKVKASSWLMG